MFAKLSDIKAVGHLLNNRFGFILKVLLLSGVIAVVIKYLAPSLAVAATPTNALVAVFLPTVLMAIVLGWRAWQMRDYRHPSE